MTPSPNKTGSWQVATDAWCAPIANNPHARAKIFQRKIHGVMGIENLIG
jgi:hypothetical protein